MTMTMMTIIIKRINKQCTMMNQSLVAYHSPRLFDFIVEKIVRSDMCYSFARATVRFCCKYGHELTLKSGVISEYYDIRIKIARI